MNLFARRLAVLAVMSCPLAAAAAPAAFDDSAFKDVRARLAAMKDRPPVVVIEPIPENTFPGMQVRFAAARIPDAAALRLNQDWTCFSVRANGANSFDRQTFVQFDGKFMSRGTPEPAQALEFKANAGSIYAPFKLGKRAMDYTAVAAYRVLSDGRLIRELSLLYSVWPGAEPAGVRSTEPQAINKAESDAILRMNSRSTVYSYSVCEPAAK